MNNQNADREDGSPVSPAEGEVEEMKRLICQSRSCEGAFCCEWPANMGRRNATDCPVRRGGYDDAVSAILSSPYITRLREQLDELVEALDPDALDAISDEIGEHYINSARAASLRGIAKRQRIALRNADTSGLSSRRDEMVTPSAEAASPIAPKITGAMGE